MAKKPKPRTEDDTRETRIPPESTSSEDSPSDDAPGESTADDETGPKAVPVPESPKVVKLSERQFPIASFARGKGPIGGAFMSEHNIKNKGRTVKRTRAEWDALYKVFLNAPRG